MLPIPGRIRCTPIVEEGYRSFFCSVKIEKYRKLFWCSLLTFNTLLLLWSNMRIIVLLNVEYRIVYPDRQQLPRHWRCPAVCILHMVGCCVSSILHRLHVVVHLSPLVSSVVCIKKSAKIAALVARDLFNAKFYRTILILRRDATKKQRGRAGEFAAAAVLQTVFSNQGL